MLALIAGRGALPGAVVRAATAGGGMAPVVLALDGNPPDSVVPDATFRIEHLGSLIADLQRRGVTRICMAGGINRPELDAGQIDAATLPLVPAMMQALGGGDDAALRVVIGIFQDAGFEILGPDQVAAGLFPPAGVPTVAQPDAAHRQDANRAATIHAALAGADIGQGCCVLRGQALAVEGVFGTDWMLAGLRARPDAGGGIFFKAPKTGQDRRADLPVIGPDTVDAVAAARLSGLVIEAGGVMVLDPGDVVARCDALGLFLWVRERG